MKRIERLLYLSNLPALICGAALLLAVIFSVMFAAIVGVFL